MGRLQHQGQPLHRHGILPRRHALRHPRRIRPILRTARRMGHARPPPRHQGPPRQGHRPPRHQARKRPLQKQGLAPLPQGRRLRPRRLRPREPLRRQMHPRHVRHPLLRRTRSHPRRVLRPRRRHLVLRRPPLQHALRPAPLRRQLHQRSPQTRPLRKIRIPRIGVVRHLRAGKGPHPRPPRLQLQAAPHRRAGPRPPLDPIRDAQLQSHHERPERAGERHAQEQDEQHGDGRYSRRDGDGGHVVERFQGQQGEELFDQDEEGEAGGRCREPG
mmetsp:Transcript_15168/g.38863  ORF Transcript_15168/g.38863 Transcript_15168/m.38863 type:complete len:273 (-) Transcript_15168:78-896(-)